MFLTKKFLSRLFEILEVPYMILGFAYLGVYTAQVVLDPPAQVFDALEVASTVIYWLFALDIILKLIYIGKGIFTGTGILKFVKQNWLGLASLLLPAFRALRVLGVLLVLRGLSPFMTNRASKVGLVVGVTLPLLLFTSAVSILDAERGADGSNINSFPDALWWALVSVTTVGYGDKFPVTEGGRFIASLMMLVGIGLFSSLTALLAAWVMGENQSNNQSTPAHQHSEELASIPDSHSPSGDAASRTKQKE